MATTISASYSTRDRLLRARAAAPAQVHALLAPRIVLARTSPLLALEDDQHVDPARVLLVLHRRRTQ